MKQAVNTMKIELSSQREREMNLYHLQKSQRSQWKFGEALHKLAYVVDVISLEPDINAVVEFFISFAQP